MDFPTRWQSEILEALREEGRASITELAQRLNISDETVRRHVKALAEQGVIQRVHGAALLPEAATEPPFSRRMKERTQAKRAIAQKVASLVEDGMTLLVDSGSTTAYVARALLERRNLNVVTNSLEIAHTLIGRRGHTVHLAGGVMRADIGCAVGPEAHALIAQFRADLAILSVGSVDAVDGYRDFDVDEARIARAMIERSRRVVVAADARKFVESAPVCICGLESVGTLVTDAAPPAAIFERLVAAGAEIVVAGEPPANRDGP